MYVAGLFSKAFQTSTDNIFSLAGVDINVAWLLTKIRDETMGFYTLLSQVQIPSADLSHG